MRYLKQSTQVVQMVGPFLDKTDGVTEEAGLAGVGTEISKEPGAAFGAGPVLGTYDSDGWYPVTLTTTHTNTIGALIIKVHDAATHLPVWHEFHVLAANVYDSLFGAATDKLEVDVQEINSGTAAADNLKTAGDNYSATRGLAGTALPAAAADAAGGLIISDAGGLDADAEVVKAAAIKTKTDSLTFTVAGKVDANATHLSGDSVAADNAESFFDGTGYAGTGNVIPTVTTLTGHTAQTGDCFARLGAPAGASVSADVAAVKTDTGNLVTRITATLFSGITSLAQWLGLLGGKQTGDSTARTELRATGAGSGTYDETTDSTQAIRDRGDAAWTTATGFSTHSAADVWAAATRTLTANTNFNDPTAATIAAAVVGETMTELAAIPSASPTLKQAVALLYMALRNKVTVSATAKVIHNDAGTALGTKALSDDGTTYTEAEIA